MGFTIAVAGKGGVGKTLVAGMLARWLVDNGYGPVLAVDADANSNLHEILGMEPGESVGSIREELKKRAAELPAGMSKAEFIEYKIETTLVEGDNLDLINMGRPEGPGCYCYANNLLREVLQRVANRYRAIVIDNEAGMEHLSRRLLQQVDLLLLVSDPTLRGVDTAFRLSRVPDEVETRVRRKALLVNRVRCASTSENAENSDPYAGLSQSLASHIQDGPLPFTGCIFEDPEVTRCDQELGSLSSLYPAVRWRVALRHWPGSSDWTLRRILHELEA